MTMKVLRWSTTLAYAGFLFYLSSRAWPQAADLPPYVDKLIHVGLYLPLGFLLGLGLPLLLATGIAALYGVSDEIHQHFVPGRTGVIADVVADALGGWGGAWVAWRWRERR